MDVSAFEDCVSFAALAREGMTERLFVESNGRSAKLASTSGWNESDNVAKGCVQWRDDVPVESKQRVLV
jgi:hypothetical protein